MSPGLRKFALTTHLTLSIGWIGAVLSYLLLVIAAMTRANAETLRAAWITMELIGWNLIVPLAISSLLTGLVLSLGSPWGLFRHYWVLVSFVLTVVAAGVLIMHMPSVSVVATIAVRPASADVTGLKAGLTGELLHAGFGLLVLLLVEALNVYKPKGLTAYGRRKVPVSAPSRAAPERELRLASASPARAPLWLRVAGLHAIGLALLFVVLHVLNGGMGRH